jgi:hypothetical protein
MGAAGHQRPAQGRFWSEVKPDRIRKNCYKTGVMNNSVNKLKVTEPDFSLSVKKGTSRGKGKARINLVVSD